MPGWSVGEHKTAGGHSHFAEFVASLADAKDIKDAAVLTGALRALGNQLREPRSKPLNAGLFELRGTRVWVLAGTARRAGRRLREEADRHASGRASADAREIEGSTK